MKKMFFAVVAVFSCVVICGAAEGTISANGTVNLRLKPTIQSPVVGSVSGGEKVDVQEVDGNWVRIAAPAGVKVYLSEVQVINDKTRADLNMRTKMSSTSASFGVLPAGSAVKALPERSHGWVRIAPPENLSVYVARIYVNFDASSVPTAAAKDAVAKDAAKDAAPAPDAAKPKDADKAQDAAKPADAANPRETDKAQDAAKPAEQPAAEVPAKSSEAK